MSPFFDADHYQQLLDGLEISEVNFQNLRERTFRLDPEYFQAHYLTLENVLKQKPHGRLGEIALVTDGIHTSIDYAEDSGINLLSATSPRAGFVNLDRGVQISAAQHNANPRTALKKGDVLISTVGTIGNAALATDDCLPANTDRHIGIIRLENPSFAPTLTVFLLGKYGRFQSNRETSGNVQQNLFLYMIKDFALPKFSEQFMEAINSIYEKAISSRRSAHKLYKQASNTISALAGNSASAQYSHSLRQLKDSFLKTGRLDAEYYQPKYDEFEQFVLGKEHKRIRELFSLVKDKPVFTGEISNYIEISDIDISTGESVPHACLVSELPANAKIKPTVGDVLVSKVRPNRGAVSVISNRYDNFVVSGAFTTLRPRHNSQSDLSYYLQLVLRTDMYKEWLLKYNVGTSYPVIKDEDILNLPVPIFTPEVQEELIGYVKKSFLYRQEAKALLENAVHAVEIAVEDSEEMALAALTERE